jgi:hypothetical protein
LSQDAPPPPDPAPDDTERRRELLLRKRELLLRRKARRAEAPMAQAPQEPLGDLSPPVRLDRPLEQPPSPRFEAPRPVRMGGMRGQRPEQSYVMEGTELARARALDAEVAESAPPRPPPFDPSPLAAAGRVWQGTVRGMREGAAGAREGVEDAFTRQRAPGTLGSLVDAPLAAVGAALGAPMGAVQGTLEGARGAPLPDMTQVRTLREVASDPVGHLGGAVLQSPQVLAQALLQTGRDMGFDWSQQQEEDVQRMVDLGMVAAPFVPGAVRGLRGVPLQAAAEAPAVGGRPRGAVTPRARVRATDPPAHVEGRFWSPQPAAASVLREMTPAELAKARPDRTPLAFDRPPPAAPGAPAAAKAQPRPAQRGQGAVEGTPLAARGSRRSQRGETALPDVPVDRGVEPIASGTAVERAAVAQIMERVAFGPERRPGLGTRLADKARKFYQRFVTDEAPLVRLEKRLPHAEGEVGPAAQARFVQGGAARAADTFYRTGMLEERTGPAVLPALKKVRSEGYSLRNVTAYGIAKRAETGYVPRGMATGLDPAAVRRTVAFYEAKHPKVVEAAKAVSDAYDTLFTRFVEAAGWSPERVAAVKAANPFYVRFLRMVGEESAQPVTGRRAQMGTRGPGRVKGGDQPFRDPLVLLQEDFRNLVAAGDMAYVHRTTIEWVRRDPAAVASMLEEMTPAEFAKARPDYAAVVEQARREGQTAATPEVWAEYMDRYTEQARTGEFVAFQDPVTGKSTGYRVKDPGLKEYLEGMGKLPAEWGSGVMKVFEASARVTHTGVTTATPFILSNAWRDIKTYLFYRKGGVGTEHKAFARLGQGFYHAFRGALAEKTGRPGLRTPVSEVYLRARVEGLPGVTRRVAVREMARMEEGLLGYYGRRPDRAVVDAGKEALDTARVASGVVEAAPRAAAIMDRLQEIGWKPGQKLTRDQFVRLGLEGGEITTNFRAGGRWAKKANTFYLFTNAAIQGIERYRVAWRDRPVDMAVKSLVYGVLPKAALWALWHQDEEHKEAYRRMPAWRRLMMNVPGRAEDGTVGVALSLPIAHEVGAVGAAFEAAMVAMDEEDPVRGSEVAKDLLGVLSPLFRPWEPSGWPQGLMEAFGTKRDSFTGAPVNPLGTQDVERVRPAEVARDSTGSLARWFSDFLHRNTGSEVTAAEIDHVVGRALGTLGKQALRAAPSGETETADNPFVGRFVPRASESQWVSSFYDRMRTFRGHQGAARILRERGDDRRVEHAVHPQAGRALRQVTDRLSALRDRYKVTPAAQRPALAREMDRVAQTGLRILDNVDRGLETRAPGAGR